MILNLGKPNAKQAEFFRSRRKFTGYGGARGGGKSWAMRTKLACLAMRYPNLNILLLRRTLVDLKENHLVPLQRLLKGVAAYKSSDKVFEFANGSRLRLGYCNNEADTENYRGQEYDVIGVEECTQFAWSEIRMLMTANRNTKPYFKPRMYFTGNPGGVGHGWFKRLFVDRSFTEKEDPDDYIFIPATVEDNEILMKWNPEYVKVLDSLPEKQRRAQRFGDWSVFEGQFFEEFTDAPEHYVDRKHTHVIEPFDVPSYWRIVRSFDWGYSRPFSVGWWAVDPDGTFYRVAELYGCTGTPNEGVKWTAEQIFAKVREIESEHPNIRGRDITGVADPACWDTSSGLSVADAAAKLGIYFVPADHSRISGWQECHSRMQFDANGIPRMYVFNTCRNAIRTIPEQIYDSTHAEDLDTDGEDHICDEMRYAFMTQPIRPKIPEADKVRIPDPLDLRRSY